MEFKGVMRLMVSVLLVAALLPRQGASDRLSLSDEADILLTKQDTHFVFVHGTGHGAWCWYKVVTILQEAGYQATALDMISDGRDKTIADTVTSLAEYAKPLTDFLADVSGRVVLVGHSLGGITISYAMEQHPEKIAKAIFLASFMPLNGQSAVTTAPPDLIIQPLAAAGVIRINFARGPSGPPTSLEFNLTLVPTTFYNKSPTQDLTLALSLLDIEPYIVLAEPVSLTPSRYGSIPRFFVKTDEDHAFTQEAFDFIIRQNPPQKVFFIPGSDHSPFLGKPVQFSELLVDISRL